MKKQTLVQAVHLALSGKSTALARAANYLDGCPAGGWGETEQAWRQVSEELPHRSARTYTVSHFVSAVYSTDFADRYRTRDASEAIKAAAKIEASKA